MTQKKKNYIKREKRGEKLLEKVVTIYLVVLRCIEERSYKITSNLNQLVIGNVGRS